MWPHWETPQRWFVLRGQVRRNKHLTIAVVIKFLDYVRYLGFCNCCLCSYSVTAKSSPEDPKAAELNNEIDRINRTLDQCEKQILHQLRVPLDNSNPTQDLENRQQKHEVNMKKILGYNFSTLFSQCCPRHAHAINNTDLTDSPSRNLLRLWEGWSQRSLPSSERWSLFWPKNPWALQPCLCPSNSVLPMISLTMSTLLSIFIAKSKMFRMTWCGLQEKSFFFCTFFFSYK